MYKASMNETLEEVKKVVITSSRHQRKEKKKIKTIYYFVISLKLIWIASPIYTQAIENVLLFFEQNMFATLNWIDKLSEKREKTRCITVCFISYQ